MNALADMRFFYLLVSIFIPLLVFLSVFRHLNRRNK